MQLQEDFALVQHQLSTSTKFGPFHHKHLKGMFQPNLPGMLPELTFSVVGGFEVRI
jgi:hypothetical protein